MPPSRFDRAPFLVLWELTRACALACRHCRAEAVRERSEQELDTAECRTLLEHMRQEFGPVLVVLTGGDPLQRADLTELIAHGDRLGLRMTVTPAATPLLTRAALAELHQAGVRRVAISLDGVDAATHDDFRQEAGSFQRTMQGLTWARELGIETQINSSIGPHNHDQLQALADIVAWQQAVLWSVFLIVPTGRAATDLVQTAAEHERTYRALAGIAEDAPFDVKTTAGQPFYRVQAQRLLKRHPELHIDELTPQRFGLRAPGGVNDGKGVVFVGHDGAIKPSGFLDATCGTIRTDALASVYRDHPLFRELRDPDLLGGKCGRCEYRRLCGGSRARSHALTGDALAADPTCVYHPPAGVD